MAGASRAAALAPLAAGALLALAAFTPLVGLFPGLGVWRGPLGAVAVGAGLVATLLRWSSTAPLRRLAGLPPAVLFAVVFLADTVVGLHYVRGIQASGDEVEYLMLAQSLWREHDLDLADQFERGDHLEYTPGLGAMPFGTFRADGRPVSTHSPGLPLLLAPAYALGGRAACVVLLALLAALLALETWRLARALAGPEAAAFAWLLAAGPPACFYSFHMYSEVPAALAAVAALRLLLCARGTRAAVAAALLASALPWLHVKMIPATVVLGVTALVLLRGRERLAFLGVAALAGAAYLAFYWQVYGAPTPLALYGSKLPKKVKRADPLEGLAGLFLDGAYGLLPAAPAFLLALTSWGALLRPAAREPDTRARLAVVAIAVAILAPLPAWQTWWAGHCPPARFFVPLAPFLAILAALRLEADPRGLARWRGPLAAFGLAFALFTSLPPGEHLLLNDHGEPPLAWELLGGQPTVSRYLPLLTGGDPVEWRVAMVWALVLAAILALDWLARRREQVDRAFSTPWLPITLWLAATMAIDLWARRI